MHWPHKYSQATDGSIIRVEEDRKILNFLFL